MISTSLQQFQTNAPPDCQAIYKAHQPSSRFLTPKLVSDEALHFRWRAKEDKQSFTSAHTIWALDVKVKVAV